jgi:hypothetical protein
VGGWGAEGKGLSCMGVLKVGGVVEG